jgi:hypothetical protein
MELAIGLIGGFLLGILASGLRGLSQSMQLRITTVRRRKRKVLQSDLCPNGTPVGN